MLARKKKESRTFSIKIFRESYSVNDWFMNTGKLTGDNIGFSLNSRGHSDYTIDKCPGGKYCHLPKCQCHLGRVELAERANTVHLGTNHRLEARVRKESMTAAGTVHNDTVDRRFQP